MPKGWGVLWGQSHWPAVKTGQIHSTMSPFFSSIGSPANSPTRNLGPWRSPKHSTWEAQSCQADRSTFETGTTWLSRNFGGAASCSNSQPSCPSLLPSCGSADRPVRSLRRGGGCNSSGRCQCQLRSSWESSPGARSQKHLQVSVPKT